jgi:D-amino peptidase
MATQINCRVRSRVDTTAGLRYNVPGEKKEAAVRVYIMTDLEGVSGVLDSENWCLSQGAYFAAAKELLTREVNAAVEGFIQGGATEIVVADGHGPGAIVPSLLHARAELVRNWPAGRAYPFSLDSRPFDAMAWIGQHPKAGTVGGHLCHTGSMALRDVSVNGTSIGEFGEMALCGGELGVRVIFATGCEAFTREALALAPGIETVAVKRGLQTDPGHHVPEAAYRRHNISAVHLAPEEARRRIRAGAQRAIERAGREAFGLVRLAPPYRRVAVLRGNDQSPPRIGRSEHPTSVIALLNAPAAFAPIAIDPLDYAKANPT